MAPLISPAPLNSKLLSTEKARYEELQIINIRAIYSQQIFSSGEISSASASESFRRIIPSPYSHRKVRDVGDLNEVSPMISQQSIECEEMWISHPRAGCV